MQLEHNKTLFKPISRTRELMDVTTYPLDKN